MAAAPIPSPDRRLLAAEKGAQLLLHNGGARVVQRPAAAAARLAQRRALAQQRAGATPDTLPRAPPDVSYARGYVSQWDNFHHQTEPVVTRVPYMLVPGCVTRVTPRCARWPSNLRLQRPPARRLPPRRAPALRNHTPAKRPRLAARDPSDARDPLLSPPAPARLAATTSATGRARATASTAGRKSTTLAASGEPRRIFFCGFKLALLV